MKLEVGNVLVRRGALAPFIVDHIWYISDDQEVFEIDGRRVIDRFGGSYTSERKIRSGNLSMYDFVAKEFMDETYVKWAIRERGGLFMPKKPEPAPKPPEPEKPAIKQVDIVKAVFYRQNRMLNPGVTVEEVERLWNENYFPLYMQVCFELSNALERTGSLTPLNYEPPNPPTPAPDSYKAKVFKARPYVVPVLPPSFDEEFSLQPEVLKLARDLLDKHNVQGEERGARLNHFRETLNGILQGADGDCLTEVELQHIVDSSDPRSHIIAVIRRDGMTKHGMSFILDSLRHFWISLEALSNVHKGTSEVEPDFSLPRILTFGSVVEFGKLEISCQEIVGIIDSQGGES